MSEQDIMKYHASSCYRRFQLDLGKIVSLSVELSESLQQAQEPTDTYEQEPIVSAAKQKI